MASQPLPTLDLTDLTVRDLTEDCLSTFPYCTQLGCHDHRVLMDNMLESLHLWAQSTAETAAASGSLEQALESRPDDLQNIKSNLFMISVELNSYAMNSTDYEAAKESILTIGRFIESLDMMTRAVIG
ncbi:hypothetical protein H634G_04911 [Metarhizium anisopliae BRIP 53293]|uniref:Uncharacterized protein n=1 Tax=Metarhizium anisopliae BRIP 53293 TaxID=1291518 RepID=A0A0D9P3B9_METAN|nr:hypothetical protein H634G_04911 [Metarhizium anisopliae BRIP 53293]KJK88232.1 hypothetical protein H633G_07915 [Metarhizium anisopliae BRIP 53284]